MGWNRATESLRRVYGEVVRGRTRVRVVVAQENSFETTPKFVLSPYRSGTTLLRYCLDSHPDLAVPPETDYLIHLGAALVDEASIQGLRDLGYETADIRRQIAGLGRSFLDTYAVGKGKTHWVDKSPRYAEDPALITAMYPNAKFLVMHRDPLDQIHSFTKGGKYVPAALRSFDDSRGRALVLGAAEYWKRVTEGLLEFSARWESSVHVFRYEELCDDPSRILGGALEHLGMHWDSAVLNYHEHDHDLGREAGRVQGTVGFSRSEGAWREWPAGLSEEVWEIVEPAASLLGYLPPASSSR